MYAKISKKGQITIPKSIREKLHIGKGSAVLFIVENDEIKLKGVPAGTAESLAGSLKEFAGKYEPIDKIRDKIHADIAKKASEEDK